MNYPDHEYVRPTMHLRFRRDPAGKLILQQLFNHHADKEGFEDGLWIDVPVSPEA